MGLGSRGMMVGVARQCAQDRKEWRALGNMKMPNADAVMYVLGGSAIRAWLG